MFLSVNVTRVAMVGICYLRRHRWPVFGQARIIFFFRETHLEMRLLINKKTGFARGFKPGVGNGLEFVWRLYVSAQIPA